MNYRIIKRNLVSHIEAFASSDLVCEKVVDRLQLVANKARFRILCLLRHDWFSVNEIVEVIQAGRLSNISQQLKMLTLAGLIEKRKEGRSVYYTLKDPEIRLIIDFLERHYLEADK
ncbi:MAG: transcriptional regulator [Spirochaetales bacterium]|nr:MAG: transcriptional regulator [Spirochaetales bacterium]